MDRCFFDVFDVPQRNKMMIVNTEFFESFLSCVNAESWVKMHFGSECHVSVVDRCEKSRWFCDGFGEVLFEDEADFRIGGEYDSEVKMNLEDFVRFSKIGARKAEFCLFCFCFFLGGGKRFVVIVGKGEKTRRWLWRVLEMWVWEVV